MKGRGYESKTIKVHLNKRKEKGNIFTFEEVDVVRLIDGSIRELLKSKGELIQNFTGAVLLEKYFWAKEVEDK